MIRESRAGYFPFSSIRTKLAINNLVTQISDLKSQINVRRTFLAPAPSAYPFIYPPKAIKKVLFIAQNAFWAVLFVPLVSFHYRRQESKAYDLRPSAQNKRIISFPTHYNWFSSPLSYRHPPLCLMETPSCLKTTFHGHPAVAFSLSFFLLVVRAFLSVLEVFLYFSPFIFSAGICFKAFSWFCLLKDLRGREKNPAFEG